MPDLAALGRAVLAWIDRHETLRSALTCTAGVVQRETLPPGAVGLRPESLGVFAASAPLASRLEEEFDRGTDPLDWPSFVFAVVSHGDSGTVYASFDHSNVDGYSILMVAQEIAELYEAERDGRGAHGAGLSTVGSYVDFAGQEREAATEISVEHEVVDRWRAFLRRHDGALPGLASAGAPVGETELVLGPKETGELGVACRKLGGMPMTGTLAALAEAIRDETGQTGFASLVSLHTRDAARWSRSMGWFVGLAPLEFPAPPGATFAALMGAAAAGVRQAKPVAAVPLGRVEELLGRPLRPRFVVSYMDLRRVPGADRWPGWKAATLRSRGARGDEVHVWITHSREGLRVAARYPEGSAVPACLERMRLRLRRLARTTLPIPEPA